MNLSDCSLLRRRVHGVNGNSPCCGKNRHPSTTSRPSADIPHRGPRSRWTCTPAFHDAPTKRRPPCPPSKTLRRRDPRLHAEPRRCSGFRLRDRSARTLPPLPQRPHATPPRGHATRPRASRRPRPSRSRTRRWRGARRGRRSSPRMCRAIGVRVLRSLRFGSCAARVVRLRRSASFASRSPCSRRIVFGFARAGCEARLSNVGKRYAWTRFARKKFFAFRSLWITRTTRRMALARHSARRRVEFRASCAHRFRPVFAMASCMSSPSTPGATPSVRECVAVRRAMRKKIARSIRKRPRSRRRSARERRSRAPSQRSAHASHRRAERCSTTSRVRRCATAKSLARVAIARRISEIVDAMFVVGATRILRTFARRRSRTSHRAKNSPRRARVEFPGDPP